MTRIPLALVALAIGACPAVAQDRTPPAGSYDALTVPADIRLRPVPLEAYSSLAGSRPKMAPHTISRMPHVHR